MNILGIETSCDETAAAVVRDGTDILSNIISSSSDLHSKTGGIIPEQAARQQINYIIPVIEKAVEASTEVKSFKDINAIAVTVGPGLIGSLLVGVETAKVFAYLYKKPIIPVNHLSAHIYANWLQNKPPEFPVLALVVSGGHTDLVSMSDHGKLEWLGGTRDDAAGEAFDKTARLLGLPYPGGPAISVEAEKYLKKNPNQKLNLFPRPMIDENNLEMSFSGLKTSVKKHVSNSRTKATTTQLAAEVQEAIVDVLVKKTVKAVKKYKPKTLLLAGGVAANRRLTEKFIGQIKAEKLQVIFHVPLPKLCTDNATYIASHAHFNYKTVDWKKIKANPQLSITGEI